MKTLHYQLSPLVLAASAILACGSHARVRVAEFEVGEYDAYVELEMQAKLESFDKCGENSSEIEGYFCPSVVQECLEWQDKDNPRGPNVCLEFAKKSSTCLSNNKTYVHFCIDKYEWPNKKGALPSAYVSWNEAKFTCESIGKRLCTDVEFTVACEGPNIKPYPYGDGYHRDVTACNIGKIWIDPWKNSPEKIDGREVSGNHPNCVSDYDVHDLVGNVDEFVVNTSGFENKPPWISGLAGGHWVGGIRNRCRALTVSHEPSFFWYETGFRCCSDIGQKM